MIGYSEIAFLWERASVVNDMHFLFRHLQETDDVAFGVLADGNDSTSQWGQFFLHRNLTIVMLIILWVKFGNHVVYGQHKRLAVEVGEEVVVVIGRVEHIEAAFRQPFDGEILIVFGLVPVVAFALAPHQVAGHKHLLFQRPLERQDEMVEPIAEGLSDAHRVHIHVARLLKGNLRFNVLRKVLVKLRKTARNAAVRLNGKYLMVVEDFHGLYLQMVVLTASIHLSKYLRILFNNKTIHIINICAISFFDIFNCCSFIPYFVKYSNPFQLVV